MTVRCDCFSLTGTLAHDPACPNAKARDDAISRESLCSRSIHGWRLRAWYLFVTPRHWERHNVLGWNGWVLNVLQPNGGHSSIPARTRLGAWWKLMRDRNSMGYLL